MENLKIQKQIMLFKNEEFGKVRGLEIDGEPYLVGKDVAEILGYSNPSDAIYKHVDKEDKSFVMLERVTDMQNGDVSSSQTKTTFINESGIYSLVFSSKLPDAKKFKRWVTHEVLPKIRKTGGYILGEENIKSEDELVLKAMTVLQNKVNKLKENEDKLKLENKQKTQMIGELQPKVDYLDDILQNPSTINITVIAKDYGMSASSFNRLLADLKIQYKQTGQWFLYSKYQDKGYTHSQTTSIERGGKSLIVMNTKWTQKGRLFLYNLLKKHNIIPLIEQNEVLDLN